MSSAAHWHDLEQNGYRDDLPLWRELAAGAEETLELGAGTGRVAVEIAGLTRLTAVDRDPDLLVTLCRRVGRRLYSVVVATQDVLTLDLGERRFDLVIAPALLIQIVGGLHERGMLWERIAEHLEPGGLAAVVYADADAMLRSQGLGPAVERHVGARIYRSMTLPTFELDEWVAHPWERQLIRKRRHGSRRAVCQRDRTTYTVVDALYARVTDVRLVLEAELAGLRYVERRELPSATHLDAAVLIFTR